MGNERRAVGNLVSRWPRNQRISGPRDAPTRSNSTSFILSFASPPLPLCPYTLRVVTSGCRFPQYRTSRIARLVGQLVSSALPRAASPHLARAALKPFISWTRREPRRQFRNDHTVYKPFSTVRALSFSFWLTRHSVQYLSRMYRACYKNAQSGLIEDQANRPIPPLLISFACL